jgi:hypothetical protein
MKRWKRIALWVYLTGSVLTEVINLRFGYVMGAFTNTHGPIDFTLYLAVTIMIAATWPLWAIMIVLQFLGIEIYLGK